MATGPSIRESSETNPNALHDFHATKRGPRNVPQNVHSSALGTSSTAKDPGHPYAATKNIKFDFYEQRSSNAPFGYEHFVSLPPAYNHNITDLWPLILFLHGAGESQKAANESYASIRHGIPKVILCYDKLQSLSTENEMPSIDIPPVLRPRKGKQLKQGDKSADPVESKVCRTLAENFITVTPSLDMKQGYGWNELKVTPRVVTVPPVT